MSLQEIYNNYVTRFQTTGEKTYPDRLLALLLLPEKNNFEPLKVEEGKFYQRYQEEIDAKIEQVINDFHISKEDMIGYIEAKDIFYEEDNYEHNKIWIVFAEGFGLMHWSIMYHPELTPEQVYQEGINCFYEEKPSFKKRKFKKESKG